MSVGSISSSSMPDPEFVPRRFSVEEYRQLGEVGVLTEDDNVELLEGVITPKMMHNPPHDLALSLLEDCLRSKLAGGALSADSMSANDSGQRARARRRDY